MFWLIYRDGPTNVESQNVEPEVYCFEDYHPCTIETNVGRHDYLPYTTENISGSRQDAQTETSSSGQTIDR